VGILLPAAETVAMKGDSYKIGKARSWFQMPSMQAQTMSTSFCHPIYSLTMRS
jgi:hypothetical protein